MRNPSAAYQAARELLHDIHDNDRPSHYICPTISVLYQGRLYTFLAGPIAESLGFEHTRELNVWTRTN